MPDAYVSGEADMEWKTTEALVFAFEPEIPDRLLDIVDAEMSGVPGYSPPYLIFKNIRLPLSIYVERQFLWRIGDAPHPVKVWRRIHGEQAEEAIRRLGK